MACPWYGPANSDCCTVCDLTTWSDSVEDFTDTFSSTLAAWHNSSGGAVNAGNVEISGAAADIFNLHYKPDSGNLTIELESTDHKAGPGNDPYQRSAGFGIWDSTQYATNATRHVFWYLKQTWSGGVESVEIRASYDDSNGVSGDVQLLAPPPILPPDGWLGKIEIVQVGAGDYDIEFFVDGASKATAAGLDLENFGASDSELNWPCAIRAGYCNLGKEILDPGTGVWQLASEWSALLSVT